MTTGLATTVANGILNALRAGGTSLTVVPGTFVKLHVGDPSNTGANNPSAGSTTRIAVTHAAAAGASVVLNGAAPLWTNAGTSETLTHLSVWDAVVAGTFLYSVALTTPGPWASGNTYTLNSLSISVAPLAS